MGFVIMNLRHELHELFLKKEWFIVKDFACSASGSYLKRGLFKKEESDKVLKN